MHTMTKLLAWLLAALMAIPSACASLSPQWTQLEQAYEEGTPMTLRLSCSVSELSDPSDAALAALQRILSSLSLRMTAQAGEASRTFGQILYQDAPVLQLTLTQSPDGVQVDFPDLNEGFASAPGEADILTLLTNEESLPLPHLGDGREALWSLWDAFYDLLSQHGAQVNHIASATSIPHVGTAGQYDRYILEEEALNAAWPQVLALLEPVGASLFPQGMPSAWQQMLHSLTFSGQGTLRRVVDKENTDWGLQFNGSASLNGQDARKITLLLGWRLDKGFHVSITAPAVKGSDTFKWSLGGTYTLQNKQSTLKLEAAQTITQAGDTQHLSLNGTLKNTAGDTQDQLSGKITLTQRATGVKTTSTFQSDLTLSQDSVLGSVSVQTDPGRGRKDRWDIHLELIKDEGCTLPKVQTVTALTPENQSAALARTEHLLRGSLLSLIIQLPQEDRALLTHLIRTDSWMTAPSVSPETEDPSLWIVEEETNP